MSRPLGHSTQHGGEQRPAELEFQGRQSQKAELEPKTPMRRRELIPKSTAQPSTRRVRRLDGEKLAAANPLFQPWTMESSKKILDFSRSISPRKAEPKARTRPEQATVESHQGCRRQTRQESNSTINSTLLNATLSEHNSYSSSLSDIDIGDVTLPANLQLVNHSTELSQRMARLRQDTCVTILEDSITAEEFGRGEQTAEEMASKNPESKASEALAEPFLPKDTNSRYREQSNRERAAAMPGEFHTPGQVDKENIQAISISITDDKMEEQLVDEQPWGRESSSHGGPVAAGTSSSAGPLTSPKKAPRIPQGPHTPTKEDFWKQSLIDCWNDEHSPRKAVKVAFRSPVKPSSPTKTGKSKASFEAIKVALAVEFLRELDANITEGKISQLAESTGGVKIEWSKTLNTTAGRANWKKETVRIIPSDGSDASIAFHHHASIELAEKVIDDEERLLNVLAHEFCHLANFMINGMTKNPHGKEFKYWAAKCSETFAGRGIKVTTKHTYEIDFKYVWQCEDCSSSYKRHSKSIITGKHRCGGCKGKLVQIKPAPRSAGKPSAYQAFIKDEMKALKLANPGSPQKIIMQMAAENWTNRSRSAVPQDAQGDIGAVAAQLVNLSLGE